MKMIKTFIQSKGFTVQEQICSQLEGGFTTVNLNFYYKDTFVFHSHAEHMDKNTAIEKAYQRAYNMLSNRIGQNLNINFMRRYFEINQDKRQYNLDTNEKILTFEEAISPDPIQNFFNCMLGKQEFIEPVAKAMVNDVFVGEPYVDFLNENNIKYIERRLLDRVYGGITGFGVGASKEEAINEGIYSILRQKAIELYSIGLEGNYHVIDAAYVKHEKVIIDLLQNKNYNVFIIDLSKNIDLPVVMTLITNPLKSGYAIGFAADLNFEKCVSKSLIEAIGRLDNNIAFSFNNSDLDDRIFDEGNVLNEEIFSLLILNQSPSEIYSKDMEELCKIMETTFYVKDNSLISDFYAVSIYNDDIVIGIEKISHFTDTSKLLKKDWIIHILRQRKQLEELLLNEKVDFDELYDRHVTLCEEVSNFNYDGSFVGQLCLCDWLNCLYSMNYIIFGLFEVEMLNPERIEASQNTIFEKNIIYYTSLQNYLDSGINIDVIQNLFKMAFNKEVTEEDMNCMYNGNYLFAKYFIEPLYTFYYSEDYKNIISAYMKID
jgi:hypothetical protein